VRIGIFGGSFDPVHLGHLVVAECCREQARLDRVVFVPTAIQPFKQSRQPAAGQHRAEMLALAVGGNPAFEISTVELDRGCGMHARTMSSISSSAPTPWPACPTGANPRAFSTLPA